MQEFVQVHAGTCMTLRIFLEHISGTNCNEINGNNYMWAQLAPTRVALFECINAHAY